MTTMAEYNSPLLISIHGIRTHARWQKVLGEISTEHNIVHISDDYGYFNVVEFLSGASRARAVEKFYAYYVRMLAEHRGKVKVDDYNKRPSIIAHSFGTYIVGNCMLKYEGVKFDKVILCGSILPRDFDWWRLVARDQVGLIYNEYGLKDFWTGIVGHFVRQTGSSGRRGLEFVSPYLKQKFFDLHKHGDFFDPIHMKENWISCLKQEPRSLAIRDGSSIVELAEFSTMLDAAHEIDLEYYDVGATLPRGISLKWIEVNPQIYTFLIDRRDECVKGYLNAMPVGDALFEKLKNGRIEDYDVPQSQIVPFYADQRLKMYLMSIAVTATTRKINQGLFQEAFVRLLCGFFDKLISYAIDRRISVTEIVAVAWTDIGEKLCKWFGMKPVAADKHGNPVYWIDLKDETIAERKPLFPGLVQLLRIYRELNL